ncbi:hypothetical protein INS49_006899 [Diaporthe citri]|uniref:uncharacterized protein n=1 Tax=Diaporthe citri TaxID=83186 RepID=UPI001C817C3E|nr:uncharacterized protein INS49_006899 [Diaporthe citri]KAG6365290.1 hypothetical protein INS49_006899 [Diaporthe citri]
MMDTHAVLERRRARPDGKLEISRTKSGHSGFVGEGVSSTDPIVWGHLLPVGQYEGPGIDLADHHGSFPAPKPQGYVVGRDSECDVVIDHPYVSSPHCLIYRVIRNGQVCVFLRDLSSNGTFVNENVVGCNQVLELKDWDLITIVDNAQLLFNSSLPIHRTFGQQYSTLNLIGKGHIGQVFACREKSTGKRFAVKKHSFSPVPKFDQRKKECIAAELNLMGLCHRNIMFMKEAFVDNGSSSHVTQIAKKGELFNLIVTKSRLSEHETRHVFKQLFDAVKYLHDRNIVHRDLKPENILVLDEEHNIMICSFDLSITITAGSFDTTLCGTSSYVAPEVLAGSQHRKYGREVDIWSLGVVLYICLCGFPPFSDDLYSKEYPYTLSQQIRAGSFDYPSRYWDSVGDPALELIDSMLVVDPGLRFTIEQCLTHPWLTQAAPGKEKSAKSAPVLRRKPTMLGSDQVVPSSIHIASSKELKGPEPGYLPPDPVISKTETKAEGKISSSLIKQPATEKQEHSMNQNIHDEIRRRTGNTKMIEDIGNYLERLIMDNLKRSSEKPSHKAMLSKALSEANTAVELDNEQDWKGARSAYRKAWGLLRQVVLSTKGHEDKIKLEAMIAARIELLDQILEELKDSRVHSHRSPPPGIPSLSSYFYDQSNLPPARNFEHSHLQQSASSPGHRYAPTSDSMRSTSQVIGRTETDLVVGDDQSSRLQPELGPGQPSGHPVTSSSGRDVSETEATSPLRDDADPTLSLNHDQFAWLVNSAIDKPMSPRYLPTQLPDDLQNDIEFNDRSQQLSTWTYGYPVILPVDYKYPLTGIFSPPPDPHPLFISPSSQLSDGDIHHIFSAFPACVGFYVLINGFLQVIMPDDFDYEEGIPSLPSEFGGLKVSLIPETVCPTAGEASASSPATTAMSTRQRFERLFGPSPAQGAVAGLAGHPSANAVGVSVGCAIRAIVSGSKSKQRFEGKTGVAITPTDDNSKKYITIPTHLLTDAVIASKTMSLDSDAWRKEVKVCVASNSVEMGEVTTIFDQEPKSFPVGFSHDVSLVDISRIPDTRRMVPYAADLTWLSQQEWMDIKYNSSNLVLLDDRSREAKSIGVVDSRCQMVGQGIFRIQQQSRKRSSFLGSLSSGSSSSRTQDPRDDPSTWTSFVARSILYRVHPDYPARGGQSGVPVCVVSENTDGTPSHSAKVAGFASFVQMVSDVQKYDLEGDKLYKRLQEGRVAFYGAFQVPRELREGYHIL